jgi:4-hydroxy-tetrahydrodipicolinate synthase
MFTIARHVSKLSGYAPALPTPFDHEGGIDAAAFARLCDLQIVHGATALVVCGTTGEAPTLGPHEHDELIRMAVARARGRIPVIAGAGANATARAIALARSAQDAGADAILSVVPYCNKPTQEGLYCHFRAIADATDLPVILYDVPSRTACGLADETIARLAELPRVIGLKDAAGDVSRAARLRSLVGSDFRLLCGDDALAMPYLAQGGDGCISVTATDRGTVSREQPGSGKIRVGAAGPDFARGSAAACRIERTSPHRHGRIAAAHVRRIFGLCGRRHAQTRRSRPHRRIGNL